MRLSMDKSKDVGGHWGNEFQQLQQQDKHGWFATHLSPDQRNVFELEWTKQFESVQQSVLNGGEQEQLVAQNGMSDWENEFQTHLKSAPKDGQEDSEWFKKFDEIWKSAQASTSNDGANFDFDASDFVGADVIWGKEFSQFHHNDQNALLSEMVDPDPVTAELAPYHFEENNPFLSESDPFGLGLSFLRNRASLSEAALAFEAAVQRDPSNSDAWMHLGKTQAENEKEVPAIAALQRSVKEHPDNDQALMVNVFLFFDDSFNY